MTVRAILDRKGHDVATIGASATLADAAKHLSERRIGAVIVLDSAHGIEGLLSERDIVRAVAAHGPSALQREVREVMTREVVTCSETDTMALLMEQMTRGKFRHLPVIHEGRLVGIVSIGDVVKHRLDEMEQESNAMRDYILTA